MLFTAPKTPEPHRETNYLDVLPPIFALQSASVCLKLRCTGLQCICAAQHDTYCQSDLHKTQTPERHRSRVRLNLNEDKVTFQSRADHLQMLFS